MTLRKIKLPIASALLTIVLVVLLFTIPKWDSHRQSKVGRFVRGSDLNSTVPVVNRSKPIVLRKTSTGWVSSDPNEESWDEATRVADGLVPDAAAFVYNPPVQVDSGFLALTRREVFETLVVWPRPDSQAEKQQRQIALEHLVKTGHPPDIIPRLVDGNVYTITPLYEGYVFNGIFLILTILLLWSLSWVLLIPSWIQIANAQKLLNQGKCPYCRYSLTDLKSEKCPECGAVINPAPKGPEPVDY